jgi:exonuclease III
MFLTRVFQMSLRVVSWNLCGLSKLVRWPSTVEWLQSFDVMIIQESLQTTPTFCFNDVTRFDFPALTTRGRSSGGLIVALKNSVFGATSAAILVQEEFLLVVEVSSATGTIIIANVYVPVHSQGFNFDTFSNIVSHVETLVSQFPASHFILAGEFS